MTQFRRGHKEISDAARAGGIAIFWDGFIFLIFIANSSKSPQLCAKPSTCDGNNADSGI
jgi:hypothetical protein